jgi:hypothetical protein
MEVNPDILTSILSASREGSIEAGKKAFDPREVGSDACENAFESRESVSPEDESGRMLDVTSAGLSGAASRRAACHARAVSPAGAGG